MPYLSKGRSLMKRYHLKILKNRDKKRQKMKYGIRYSVQKPIRVIYINGSKSICTHLER